MLTRILHNSEPLQNYLIDLKLGLSIPQKQHMLRMINALLVCEADKTLAALQRQFVSAPDQSNLADFLRISPRDADTVRTALRSRQVNDLINHARENAAEQTIYLNIDDSLGEKDRASRCIEAVDWHYDHSSSGKNSPRFKNAFCYVVCTMQIGKAVATLDLQLYLREKTVRRLNRKRAKEKRLPFRSKYRIVRSMLNQLAPLLPTGWKVVVQFDSWYASARLIKFCSRRRWHVTCALKHNRKLNDKRIDKHAMELRHKWYQRIKLATASGEANTYFVRRLEGRLAQVPHKVRVYISKRHPRAKAQAYFMSTDISCSTKQVLQGYSRRWSCEVVNFYLKTQVGLADFRVRSLTAIDRYIVVVHLAWAFVEHQFRLACSSQIQTYGDIIRRHRDEHACNWLRGAIEMAVETQVTQAVLNTFLRLETQAT